VKSTPLVSAVLAVLIVLAPWAAPGGAQVVAPPESEGEPEAPAPPPDVDPRILQIVESSSPDRLEADIRKLAGFGTRNTMSDTLSDTRGIGAGRLIGEQGVVLKSVPEGPDALGLVRVPCGIGGTHRHDLAVLNDEKTVGDGIAGDRDQFRAGKSHRFFLGARLRRCRKHQRQ
jgi:hypothetical protein